MRDARPWDQVASLVKSIKIGKFDKILPASAIRSDGDTLRFPQDSDQGSFRYLYARPHAQSQLLERLGVPAKFWRDVQGRNPALAEDVLNDALASSKESLLFRGRENNLNAVLSNGYSCIDNDVVLDFAERTVRFTKATISSYGVDESTMFVKALFDDFDYRDASTDRKRLRGGFYLHNTEDGSANLRVTPFIWRETCTNGMIRTHRLDGSKIEGIRHFGLSHGAVKYAVTQAISRAMEEGEASLKRFADRRNIRVRKPNEVIDYFSARARLTQSQRETVRASYLIEPETNQFGVINAFTRAAQQFGSHTQLAVESMAGTLLVNDNMWSEAALAAA